jgi:hypothetical protein
MRSLANQAEHRHGDYPHGENESREPLYGGTPHSVPSGHGRAARRGPLLGVNPAAHVRRFGKSEEKPASHPSKLTSVTCMESSSLGKRSGSHVRVAKP